MTPRFLAALCLTTALAGAAAAAGPILSDPLKVDPGTYTVVPVAEGLDHPW